MSDVLYARVSTDLKAATDRYAAERGMSLTAGIADLVGRGLAAVADDEARLARQAELDRHEADHVRLVAELETARAQLRNVEAFVARTRQTVGTCPACRTDVSGYDLLARGHCPKRNCNESLAGLLAPEDSVALGLNERQFLLLLGAAGLLVGAAWVASKQA